MKKNNFLLLNLGVLLILSTNVNAIPVSIDNDILRAAAKQVAHENREAQAKADPLMPKVDNFCKKMTSIRMGSGYEITITDRLPPSLNTKEYAYTVVGNAEPNDKQTPTISYKCSVKANEKGKLSLTDFKVFEVKKQKTVTKNK